MSNCIVWTGGCFKNGYGGIYDKKKKRMTQAHRYYYEQVYEDIPKGLLVRHTCHNKKCINPEHLKLGTHQDNRNDDMNTGHQMEMIRGENQHQSKLTETDVLDIRKKEISAMKYSKKYSVDITQIYRVWNKQNWGWL